jgi:hypothetical protein
MKIERRCIRIGFINGLAVEAEMKVDVLTINEIGIPKWRWWSNWVDVAVFNFGGDGYLLQMKVSRRNSKQFKAVAFKAAYNVAHATTADVGNLLQMNSGS